jgi:hypothetical protein
MERMDNTIPDHCPNCNVSTHAGWAFKIGTRIVGCQSCAKIYELKDLQEMMKEKSPCGSQST